MKNLQLLGLSLLTFIFCVACTAEKEYIKIPRTRVSIPIPEGYNLMNFQTGLQKDEVQSILVMDNVYGNYFTNSNGFTRKSFEKKGIKVYSLKNTTVDGFPAKLVTTLSPDKKLKSFSIIFGDSTFSALVTSVNYSADRPLGRTLKKALLNIKYNKSANINPFEDTRFEVDTVSTDFKFSVFSSDIYVFFPFGKKQPNDKSIITITPSEVNSGHTLESISQMSFNGLANNGFYGFITDSMASVNQGNHKILLKRGDCYLKLDRKFFYQKILVDGDYCVTVNGLCDFNNEKRKSDILMFCDSVRLKNQ